MDAIFTRASVRKFTDEQISDDEIECFMRAAMAAPSAGNQQPWCFYLTRDDAIKKRLSQASPYAKPAERAPLVIVACAREEGARFPSCIPQDMSAAIENILLEVADAGLGAVWMGIAPEPERIEAVYDIIGKPEGIQPFALIAIGHPDGNVEAKGKTRYDESRVFWIEQ